MAEWLIILIRSLGLFVLLILLTRLMGKKKAAQFTYFDIILSITIGGMAALISLNIITNFAFALIGLFTWIIAAITVNLFTLKSKWFRDLIHGRETILIRHGKIMEDSLKQVQFTPEDLLKQLRQKNVFNLADVEFAIMESDGEVSVFLKSSKQPLTAKTLQLIIPRTREPQTVILDGNIMPEPLANLGLNQQWLKTELEKIGVSAENIFIAQVDSMGELYVDLFDDAIQMPSPTTRDLLFSSIKKAEADLETFALETKDPLVKKIYSNAVTELNEMIGELQPILKS